jgi:hypothetical protein
VHGRRSWEKLVSKRFKYDEVEAIGSVPRKRRRLLNSAFMPVKQTCSVDLTGVCTIEAKASFYSPTPMDLGRTALDTALLEEIFRYEGVLEKLQHVDLNIMVDSRHSFIFRRLVVAGGAYSWRIGLFNIKSTSAAMWPVILVPAVPDESLDFVELVYDHAAPVFSPVMEWDTITARLCEWHSPSWQAKHVPAIDIREGIRLFATGVERPVVEILAELCWCDWHTPELAFIAKALKIPVRGRTWLCYLLDMTMWALQIDELQALDKLKKKIGELQPNDEWDLIMEIDEAQQVLTREDETHVVKEQDILCKSRAAFQSFCVEYAARRTDARARARAAGGGAGGAGGGAGAAPAVVKRNLRDCDISQGHGRAFMPPGGFLWQSRGKSMWLARVPPLKEVRARWDEAGPDAAQYKVIVLAWKQWCLLEGVVPADCPMLGIYASHPGKLVLRGVGAAPLAPPSAAAPAHAMGGGAASSSG